MKTKTFLIIGKKKIDISKEIKREEDILDFLSTFKIEQKNGRDFKLHNFFVGIWDGNNTINAVLNNSIKEVANESKN